MGRTPPTVCVYKDRRSPFSRIWAISSERRRARRLGVGAAGTAIDFLTAASGCIRLRQPASVGLPSAPQDEVAADDEGQGDHAGAQGHAGAGQRPAARTAGRPAPGSASGLRRLPRSQTEADHRCRPVPSDWQHSRRRVRPSGSHSGPRRSRHRTPHLPAPGRQFPLPRGPASSGRRRLLTRHSAPGLAMSSRTVPAAHRAWPMASPRGSHRPVPRRRSC